jgi:hypothetical protein
VGSERSIGESVAESRRVMQKTLCTHVSRLGVTLNNFLGKQTHAFREREGLYGAFRQHPSRYIRLDKVTSHCNDALGVQLVELRVIHLKVAPCSISIRYFGRALCPSLWPAILPKSIEHTVLFFRILGEWYMDGYRTLAGVAKMKSCSSFNL